MAKKRYSLNERIRYYSNVCANETKKWAKTKKTSKRLLYADGYLQGAVSGLSLDYNKLSKYEKLGQQAGFKARRKSENIKF